MKYVDEFELNNAVAAIEFGEGGPITAPNYCNLWADGGPLIEKYGICLAKLKNGKWLACGNQQGITSRIWRQESDKPLVAAMLCVVDLVERAKRRGAHDA